MTKSLSAGCPARFSALLTLAILASADARVHGATLAVFKGRPVTYKRLLLLSRGQERLRREAILHYLSRNPRLAARWPKGFTVFPADYLSARRYFPTSPRLPLATDLKNAYRACVSAVFLDFLRVRVWDEVERAHPIAAGEMPDLTAIRQYNMADARAMALQNDCYADAARGPAAPARFVAKVRRVLPAIGPKSAKGVYAIIRKAPGWYLLTAACFPSLRHGAVAPWVKIWARHNLFWFSAEPVIKASQAESIHLVREIYGTSSSVMALHLPKRDCGAAASLLNGISGPHATINGPALAAAQIAMQALHCRTILMGGQGTFRYFSNVAHLPISAIRPGKMIPVARRRGEYFFVCPGRPRIAKELIKDTGPGGFVFEIGSRKLLAPIVKRVLAETTSQRPWLHLPTAKRLMYDCFPSTPGLTASYAGIPLPGSFPRWLKKAAGQK